MFVELTLKQKHELFEEKFKRCFNMFARYHRSMWLSFQRMETHRHWSWFYEIWFAALRKTSLMLQKEMTSTSFYAKHLFNMTHGLILLNQEKMLTPFTGTGEIM